MNDMSAKYQNNYLSNTVFRDIVCAEGSVSVENL